MSENGFEELLRRLAATEDEELSCSECFDLVSDYVDLEIAGADPAAALPRLTQHLRQCGVCLEEYELLRDLVRSDASGNPPSIDDPSSSS
jgi:hypothetical protein